MRCNRRAVAHLVAAPTHLAVLLLAACASGPEEPTLPPPLAVDAIVRPGPALGAAGPMPEGDALAVEVTWIWVEGPLPGLSSPATLARLFVAAGESQPFAVGFGGHADLEVAAGTGADDLVAGLGDGRFGRTAQAGSAQAAVWRGSTASFTAAGAPLRLHVERAPDGALRPVVSFAGEERAVALCASLGDGHAVVLRQARPPGKDLLWCVRARGPAAAELIEAGRAQLAAAAATPVPVPDLAARDHQVAARALASPSARRRALVQMATEHAVPLAGDLAMLADDDLLANVANEVAGGLAGGCDLAWHLERAAARALAVRAQQQDLAPELATVAQRHLGETLATATALLAALGQATDRDAFAAWLHAEHFLLLADARAATRVRACAWLRSHGGVPEGFDPLADKDERRAALAAAERVR